jgi:hypothetical protein
VATGPIPPNVPLDLESLKLQLAGLHDDDLSPSDIDAMRKEISAIRLHLQRLALEAAASADAAHHAASDR